MISQKFPFENCTNTDSFKNFKYEYCSKMNKVMDFNEMENRLEGIKSGMFSSYEYIADGSLFVEPEGIVEETDKFVIKIVPSGKVDNDKSYFKPDELEVIIEYEGDD